MHIFPSTWELELGWRNVSIAVFQARITCIRIRIRSKSNMLYLVYESKNIIFVFFLHAHYGMCRE